MLSCDGRKLLLKTRWSFLRWYPSQNHNVNLDPCRKHVLSGTVFENIQVMINFRWWKPRDQGGDGKLSSTKFVFQDLLILMYHILYVI